MIIEILVHGYIECVFKWLQIATIIDAWYANVKSSSTTG